MLHAAQAGDDTPISYVQSLNRERIARLARMSGAVVRHAGPLKAMPLGVRGRPVTPPQILVYPTLVFADDADREDIMPYSLMREIQNLVCQRLRIGRSDLLSARRDRNTVLARQVAMYLCKQHTSNSLPEIGRRFGGRDHTTVLHAVWRVDDLMNAPMGTRVSNQWPVKYCDLVRTTVKLAEATISSWSEPNPARCVNPGRPRQ